MEKKKYYVSISSREISQIKYANNDEFIVYATEDEIQQLRSKMDDMYDADQKSFWRAHVPIMPYHHDQSNDAYDAGMTEAFQMMYDLGDERTKEHITDLGILTNKHL